VLRLPGIWIPCGDILDIHHRRFTLLFDNDRLSHWFGGALFSWLMMFSLLGLPIFHLWLKIPTPTIATVTGICCATQLAVTPWLFSARATRENPGGRIAQRGIAVFAWFSAMLLLLLYYLRRSFPEDTGTRQFTAIGIGITILFGTGGIIRYVLVPSRRNDGKRSTPG
jgi:hypothetical protein